MLHCLRFAVNAHPLPCQLNANVKLSVSGFGGLALGFVEAIARHGRIFEVGPLSASLMKSNDGPLDSTAQSVSGISLSGISKDTLVSAEYLLHACHDQTNAKQKSYDCCKRHNPRSMADYRCHATNI